jgi:hypothetical protein
VATAAISIQLSSGGFSQPKATPETKLSTVSPIEIMAAWIYTFILVIMSLRLQEYQIVVYSILICFFVCMKLSGIVDYEHYSGIEIPFQTF